MKTNTEKDEEVCLKCKRILVGESKLRLCDKCINDYGSPLAVIGSIGFTGVLYLSRGWVKKNGGKVVKGAIDAIKLIKS